MTGEALYQAIKRKGHLDVQFVPDKNDIVAQVAGELKPGDISLTLGAGDIYRVGEALVESSNDELEEWNDGVMGGIWGPTLQYSNTPSLHWVEMFAMATANNDAPLAAELKSIAGLDGQARRAAGALHVDEDRRTGGLFHRSGERRGVGESARRSFDGTSENFCLLGNGSNVLISDRGVRGAVIHLAGEFKQAQWREEDDTPSSSNVGRGLRGYAIGARRRRAKDIRGLEFAEGIPGSVGGALFMNAGALRFRVRESCGSGRGDDAEAASRLHLARAQMTFSYRDSHLPEGTIITRVGLSIAQTRIGRGNFESARACRQTKKQPAVRFPQFRFDVSQSAGRLRRPADRGRRFERRAHRPSADFRASCQLHRQSRRRQGGRRATVNGAGAQRSAQTIRRRASRRGETLGRLVGELNHRIMVHRAA